ncbi:hypothetical protein ACFV2N_30115 [Streptomyces sp. NPDC059680]|uniref:hypothetical protein n=1 Tax=Streptomyces sp. NPDC059680 TaxID=3346904 RepID=UPI0036C1D272
MTSTSGDTRSVRTADQGGSARRGPMPPLRPAAGRAVVPALSRHTRYGTTPRPRPAPYAGAVLPAPGPGA